MSDFEFNLSNFIELEPLVNINNIGITSKPLFEFVNLERLYKKFKYYELENSMVKAVNNNGLQKFIFDLDEKIKIDIENDKLILELAKLKQIKEAKENDQIEITEEPEQEIKINKNKKKPKKRKKPKAKPEIIKYVECESNQNSETEKYFIGIRKHRTFDNQLTMKIHFGDYKCKSPKIFRNGKIQLTGCKNEIMVNNIVNSLIEFLHKIQNEFGNIIGDEYEFKFKYHLISANCDLGLLQYSMGIDRTLLKSILIKKEGVNYFDITNKDETAFLNWKTKTNLQGNTSILIFTTGKFNCFAYKDKSEVYGNAKLIKDIIIKYPEVIIKIYKMTKPKKNKRLK